MTGTAKTEEEEFRDIYNMYVVEVPTNKPVIRNDAPDLLFLTKEYKFKALVQDVIERHSKGQPILIGTANVETSELLHEMLEKENLPHEVLNAKNHEREAEIVSHAGEIGAITLSTNMAGRGTDIKLAPGVPELGGLAVLGTERFESRRIDNQLRGRSGRQGDPGYSRFFISTEDDLIQRFGGDSFKNRLAMILRMMNDGDEEQPLESKMLAKMVTMAQTKIEGMNYDSRKNVLKYDDVIRRQREIFYAERQQVVKAEALENVLYQIMKNAVSNKVEEFMNSPEKEFDDENLTKTFNERLYGSDLVDVNIVRGYDDDQDMINYIFECGKKDMDERLKGIREEMKNIFPPEAFENGQDPVEQQIQMILKRIILPVLDRNWREHIDDMAGFRQGIYLQQYAQNNPLELYQREGFEKFDKLNRRMNEEILIAAMHTRIRFERKVEEPKDELKGLSTNQDLSTTNAKTPVKKDSKDMFANVGPNEPCPCGSGKKFKFCHGLRR